MKEREKRKVKMALAFFVPFAIFLTLSIYFSRVMVTNFVESGGFGRAAQKYSGE